MSDEELFDLDKFIKEADSWDKKYLRAVTHSINVYEDPIKVRYSIRQFLSPIGRNEFKAVNPYSKSIWVRELLDAFLSFKGGGIDVGWDHRLHEGGIACAMVTFIDLGWVFAVNNIQFDLDRAKQKVRNALYGLSFIACFEVACYNNEDWDTDGVRGKLVCFNCHALVWATTKSQLVRRRTTIKPRFVPILGNKSGVRFDTLRKQEDLCKVIRYQAKLPLLGYRTFINSRGRKNQKPAELSLRTRYLLFLALQDYDLLDFWFGGGEGSQILREARASLERYRQRQRFDPRTGAIVYR